MFKWIWNSIASKFSSNPTAISTLNNEIHNMVITSASKIKVWNPDKYYPFAVNTKDEKIDKQFYQSDTIILYDLHDCYLAKHNIQFSRAKTLVVLYCEKNAVCYNMKQSVFPNVNTIYFCHSDPCDYQVPTRFEKAKWILHGTKTHLFESIPSNQLVLDDCTTTANYFKFMKDNQEPHIQWQGEWISGKEYEQIQKTFWGARLKELLNE